MTTITSSSIANAPLGSPNGNVVSLCSFTRPADTTVYTALDVISDSTSTAKVLAFPTAGRSGKVTAITVAMEETAATDLALWLFDSEPTNFLDNAAFALVLADAPKLVYRAILTTAKKVSAGGFQVYEAQDLNSASLPSVRPFSTATGMLYGILQTVTGYTPASAKAFYVRLGMEVD